MSKNARKRQRQERRQKPRAPASRSGTPQEDISPSLTTKAVKRPEKRSPYQWVAASAEIALTDQLTYVPTGEPIATAGDFPCLTRTIALRLAERKRRAAGARRAIA